MERCQSLCCVLGCRGRCTGSSSHDKLPAWPFDDFPCVSAALMAVSPAGLRRPVCLSFLAWEKPLLRGFKECLGLFGCCSVCVRCVSDAARV